MNHRSYRGPSPQERVDDNDPYLAGIGSTGEDDWGVTVTILHGDVESLSDEDRGRIDKALGAALDAVREQMGERIDAESDGR